MIQYVCNECNQIISKQNKDASFDFVSNDRCGSKDHYFTVKVNRYLQDDTLHEDYHICRDCLLNLILKAQQKEVEYDNKG